MPAPQRTTNDQIVRTARALLESGGPTAVTMHAVAERVGVRAPSLYKRFRDRAALLAAVAAAAEDELADRLEERDHPGLDHLARAYRGFAMASPESFRLLFTPFVPQESLQRSVAPVIRAAAELVGDERALDAARLFTAWATGFLQMELAGAFRLGGDVDGAFDYGLRRVIAALEQPESRA